MIKIDPSEIGIAILSTNRSHCLERLVFSILKFSDNDTSHVIVVDDSDDKEEHDKNKKLCERFGIPFIHTGNKIGIARNTNEAMDCIREFEYKLILNNDVEILRTGWQFIYPIAICITNIHHFCFQQEGLWGSGTKKRPQKNWVSNKQRIKTIYDFPQGAILSFDRKAFETVGYFDSKSFQGYGKSHWDWSFRVSDSGIQPEGIHDLSISNNYFLVHNEQCSTPHNQRIKDYKRNTQTFQGFRDLRSRYSNKEKRIYIPYS